jgi:dTDP-4-dehydrorhamnose 3,5-epimerase
MSGEQSRALPVGVKIAQLTTHPDDRGELTEIFRNAWHDSPLPVQWIVNRMRANVLSGMHVYGRWRYLCTVRGHMWVGLHDARPGSPTARRSAMIRLGDMPLRTLTIPPDDERRFRWDDPELALDWPCTAPEVSARDAAAGRYAASADSAFAAAIVD